MKSARTVDVKVMIGEHQVLVCYVCRAEALPEVLECTTAWQTQAKGSPLVLRSHRPPEGWREMRAPGLPSDGVRVCPNCAELVAYEMESLIGHLRELAAKAGPWASNT